MNDRVRSRVQEVIKKRKAQGLKPAKRPKKRVLFPHAQEREFVRLMRDFSDDLYKQMLEILEPNIKQLVQEANIIRGDSVRHDTISDQINNLISGLNMTLEKRTTQAQQNARNIVSQIFSNTNKQYDDAIKSLFAVNVTADNPIMTELVSSTINKTTGLMKNITSDNLSKAQTIMESGIIQGESADDLIDELQKQAGVSRRRAVNIARNETGNAYAAINKTRSKALGIKKFEWITAGDERVRPSHARLNGRIFEMNNPPMGLMPGEDYNCRCVANVVIDGED